MERQEVTRVYIAGRHWSGDYAALTERVNAQLHTHTRQQLIGIVRDTWPEIYHLVPDARAELLRQPTFVLAVMICQI